MIAVVILGVLLYAGVNVWVFRYAKEIRQKSASSGTPAQNQTSSSPSLIERIREAGKSAVGELKKLGGPTPIPKPIHIDTGKSLSPQFTPMPSQPVSTPTPTPIQGPGKYACDPDGVCGSYSETMRTQYCPATYADLNCLNQCGDTAKRCKQ